MVALGALLRELEGLMESLDGALHVVARNVERDLDRGGRDELRVDADAGQRPEGLRRHARVALHSGADNADLSEPLVLAPAGAQLSERRLGSLAVLPRGRE